LRRPVVFLFLAFAFGIALGYHLNPEPFHFIIFAVIYAVLLWIALARNRRWKSMGIVLLFLAAVLLGSAVICLANHHADPLEGSEGKQCTVEGRIITVQKKDDSSFRMLITAREAEKRLVFVNGAMEDPTSCIGKWAVIRGTVTIPSQRRNPGLFDYRLYLKTKGVRVILKTDPGNILLQEKQSSRILSMIARIKYGFLEKLAEAMEPEACGLMNGMLFGDKSHISDDIYEAFQKNGVAHILSVSGIHVGIVYVYISRILGNRKTRLFYLITALFLVFYAALSEFSPSVVRAVVMILIHMLSKVIFRRYDFLSCTAACALGMLLVNPFYLFNAGFQLSCMAVFCLAEALPWLNRRILIMEEKGRNALLTEGLRCFSPLLVIQIGMAPLTAYLFNYFSVISFFINIPVILISGIIIPLGICLIPLSALGGPVFGTGAQAAELLVNRMIWLNELFYLPEVGHFNVISPTIFLLLCFYGYFFLLTSEYFRILYQRRRVKTLAASCLLVLLISLVLSGITGSDYRHAGVFFVDVGQGDCMHIRTPEGRNILIDGGGNLNYDVGNKILLPYLLKNGVKSVDLALVTHLHTDHFLGIAQLAGSMEIKRLGVYEMNALREPELLSVTGLKRQNLLYLAKGDRIRVEKNIWIDVLYPEEKSRKDYESLVLNEEDENASCLFMKVYFNGLTVLMTGDMGTEGEREILGLYGNCPEMLDVDILKAGHHGSRFSTGDEFLEAASPEIIVFQVGKNNFGHPHSSVIEKCRKKGIIIYRNDLDGAIIITYNKNQWDIDSMITRKKNGI
jgi:competence protein ComEC